MLLFNCVDPLTPSIRTILFVSKLCAMPVVIVVVGLPPTYAIIVPVAPVTVTGRPPGVSDIVKLVLLITVSTQ